MISLYAHNKAAYEAAAELLRETGKAAVVHPTGTGKSFIGFKLCEDNPDKTVCWLSPSEYIFRTQIENLECSGAEPPENIVFFTYARLLTMTDEDMADIKPDIIIADEFHRVGSLHWGASFQKLLTLYPDVQVLGLSATNIRYLDNQRDMADELFDGNVASEMTLGEAIVRGILDPPKYIMTVYSYAGDLERYSRRAKAIRNKSRRETAEKYLEQLRRALEMADGLDVVFDKHMTERTGKYIIFCMNKEHMDEMIKQSGDWFHLVDKAPHIYSFYSEDPYASDSFDRFKADNDSTHLRLLYCIDALNEGIHVENVSGVILLRPTVSPIIYKQQIGRALSTGTGKEPIIFDVVNNFAGLYSIGAIEDEMAQVVQYYEFLGESDKVVNDRFHIIDVVENCRRLFDELEGMLSASWEFMFTEAKKYYEENGDLLPTMSYVTENGAKLGKWLVVQRINYRKQCGISKARIDKLNGIGMSWQTLHERQWEEGFARAQEYYDKNGDLDSAHGMTEKLSDWLIRQRRKQRDGELTDEQFERLSALHMVWEFEDRWEQKFRLAKEYYETHGNLDIPANYITEDGTNLGAWYRGVRNQYRDNTLSAERRKKLESIGVQWESVLVRNWMQYYEIAKQYYMDHGNLNVNINYIDPEGVRLGIWIASQRDSRKRNRLSEEQIRLLDEIGMSWNRYMNKWDSAFEYVQAYHDTFGTADVPAQYKAKDGFRLGVWVADQRRKYAAGKLKPKQIKRLESLKITWEPTEEVWRRGYEYAREYYERNGNLNVGSGYEAEDGYKLGVWLRNQRNREKDGRMTDEQRKLLEGIGIRWKPLEDRWQTGYEHAKTYFAEHGDLNVTTKSDVCEDGYPLRQWIETQRKAYRDGKLSEDRTSLLSAIGMIWNTIDSRWDEVYEIASDYYRMHGNLNIPVRYKAADGSDLWEWLRLQRKKYRKGTLSEGRKEKLDSIGIDWLFVSEREWETFYDAAKRYYLSHGNLDVPEAYRSPDGLPLGKWVERQRSRKDQLKTFGANGNQVLRLEQIGMMWDEPEEFRMQKTEVRTAVAV